MPKVRAAQASIGPQCRSVRRTLRVADSVARNTKRVDPRMTLRTWLPQKAAEVAFGFRDLESTGSERSLVHMTPPSGRSSGRQTRLACCPLHPGSRLFLYRVITPQIVSEQLV